MREWFLLKADNIICDETRIHEKSDQYYPTSEKAFMPSLAYRNSTDPKPPNSTKAKLSLQYTSEGVQPFCIIICHESTRT